jgi:hypothetical protein
MLLTCSYFAFLVSFSLSFLGLSRKPAPQITQSAAPSEYTSAISLFQVKTDQHMAKVKEQLMFEQRTIEQAEERCVCVLGIFCGALAVCVRIVVGCICVFNLVVLAGDWSCELCVMFNPTIRHKTRRI